MEQTMNLPEDDTYAILAYAATEMTSEPAKENKASHNNGSNQIANAKKDAVAAEYKRLYGGNISE